MNTPDQEFVQAAAKKRTFKTFGRCHKLIWGMTNGTETRFGRLAELQRKLDCDWPAITKAAAASETKLTELKSNLLKGSERPIAEDTSLVFFGSLARREWTAKSDCDWVLLVDAKSMISISEVHKRYEENSVRWKKGSLEVPALLARLLSAKTLSTVSAALTTRTGI